MLEGTKTCLGQHIIGLPYKLNDLLIINDHKNVFLKDILLLGTNHNIMQSSH